MVIAIAFLVGLMAFPQAREARPPDTDQTVAVTKGARLSIDNFAGEVIVKAWDRDQLRVQARHPSRTKIDVRTGPTVVTVRSSTSGAPGSVDYEITAPAWMPVKIEGTFNFITVEGTQGEVSAATVRGDIIVRGGTGSVTAKSIEGEVTVENARGRVTASSVNQGIRISGVSGDISAETQNGSIILTKVTASNVELSTINGQIVFDGAVADRGRYRFTTHNGNITATIPENSNVALMVRSYNGNFSSQHQVKGPPAEEIRRGRRLTYTLGNASAEMEMETFGGNIRVRRPGAAEPTRDKDKDKRDKEDKHPHGNTDLK
jgi:DUF4097 and DUF4098 domain-containing protein YvlB